MFCCSIGCPSSSSGRTPSSTVDSCSLKGMRQERRRETEGEGRGSSREEGEGGREGGRGREEGKGG